LEVQKSVHNMCLVFKPKQATGSSTPMITVVPKEQTKITHQAGIAASSGQKQQLGLCLSRLSTAGGLALDFYAVQHALAVVHWISTHQ
jgi:hypothetical protein